MEDNRKIDVTPDAHEAAKEFVKDNPVMTVKSWVSSLIMNATKRGIGPVEKKAPEKSNVILLENGPEVWNKPPFWTGR